MKKFIWIFAIFLVLSYLAGCSNEQTSTSIKVNESDLSEREEAILLSTAEQSFIFDFKADPSYKEVELWLDKYEFGKKTEKVNHLISDIKEKGYLMFAISKDAGEQEMSVFNVGVFSNGGTSDLTNAERIGEKGLKNMSSVWATNPFLSEQVKEEIILSSICYKSGDGSMHSLSEDFYRDVEGNLETIKKYDAVYLLKAKFNKTKSQ
ncbi:hypothetical protein J5S49_09840 [Virgibacillus halodenitrificans]|uniref:Lipoprotein n=1 Tax=Virgibacillus halodenitrificans TaxID=1482 RepID=A0AAC9J0E4_VIRHA|nr:hypothetical protein [Virgibacillus halodenitrificans]APC47540.1 hypothetical protein BME96_04860 [Virgibacillus halodenitrificans]MCG1028594.1 hypothetical protein [Virgibacillus halodenitrificans]CDQ32354.1 hypothetical protein BN993_01767 [Virgibacillus halodenitrificans]